MIQERLDQIQTKLQGASNIPEDTKNQLLALIADLRKEVGALAATHSEQAQAIAHYTDATTREATRADKQPGDLNAAIEELAGSVSGFESTHPKLTQIVNRLAVTFSGVGI